MPGKASGVAVLEKNDRKKLHEAEFLHLIYIVKCISTGRIDLPAGVCEGVFSGWGGKKY
jgi:hypothetical protein